MMTVNRSSRDLQQSRPLVSLANGGVRRDERWLVRGVDLSISRGEIVTLIGPNGSGKSTTAKMVLGILKPDEGTIERASRLKIAYVPQKVAIDWSLPLDVMRFMRLTARLSSTEIERALELTGTSHLKQAQIRNLSGGEFQRIMLARVITQKPDLLVLDEPVQGVDFNGQLELYELIRKIRDEFGCGVLLISHDLHIVMAQTDRVLCLNGHVCCHGEPAMIIDDPAYKMLFGSHAVDKLAVYRHHHDHTHLPDGRVQHADGSVTEDCHPVQESAGTEHEHEQGGKHHA